MGSLSLLSNREGMIFQLLHLVVPLALYLQQPVPVHGQQCGVLTTPDTPGPFFVSGAELDYAIAPAGEIRDRSQGVILWGQIRNRKCGGIGGATVEVWYAGGPETGYTFRPDKLWYRGRALTNKDGYYQFLATFPATYPGRPIPHYHITVTTPGLSGRSFTTQIYFRDLVPRAFENYVKTRGSQFASVQDVGAGGGLDNGGRLVNFNIKMDVN